MNFILYWHILFELCLALWSPVLEEYSTAQVFCTISEGGVKTNKQKILKKRKRKKERSLPGDFKSDRKRCPCRRSHGQSNPSLSSCSSYAFQLISFQMLPILNSFVFKYCLYLRSCKDQVEHLPTHTPSIQHKELDKRINQSLCNMGEKVFSFLRRRGLIATSLPPFQPC